MKTAVVFGGYGTFGSIVARELARNGVSVIVSGRDRFRAEKFARELGEPHRGAACDLKDRAACRALLLSCGGENAVAVNCAGPFSELGTALLEACLETGAHYCDICDDRAYMKTVRQMNERFKARGLAAVPGCASLPAISGALALMLLDDEKKQGRVEAPQSIRATLFIGNKNPKGFAAIDSAVASLNRRIQAPQGELRGFRDGEIIPVPLPFGPRKAYNFDSPDYDLFPELLGVKSVLVKVGFEMRTVNWTFNLLAHLPPLFGTRFAKFMCALGKIAPRVGHSGGAIVAELFWIDGAGRVGTLSSPKDGQRMAVLPCVFAALELCSNPKPKSGAMTAYEFLGAETLLRKIEAEGFVLHVKA